MSVTYFKGYTQHLAGNKDNDTDKDSIHFVGMTEGLYLMKLLQQEGYVLPVCKYINNIRRDVIGSMPVVVDGVSYHPRYDYAEFVNGSLKLVNPLTIPTAIAGGLVVVTNIMQGVGVPRYYALESGNLNELVESQSIKILHAVRDDKASGFIAQVNKSCILETEKVKYTFEFTSKDEVYTDFTAKAEAY